MLEKSVIYYYNNPYFLNKVEYDQHYNNLIANKDSDVLTNDRIYDIDWSILEEKDEMKYYLEPMDSVPWLLKDERKNE